MKKVLFFFICLVLVVGVGVAWLVTSPYCAPKTLAATQQQVEVRAAMDIGSGATNLKVAKVDRNTNKIIQMLFERSIPVAYQKQLEKSVDGSFDRDVMNQGIKAIKALKADADQYGVKKVVAVATAAFRHAKNSESFMKEIVAQTGVDVEVISQDEEGIMAFRAALATTSISADRAVVWDIGGGSLQIAALRAGDELIVAKGGTASAPFKNYIIEKIEGKDAAIIHSPNPMNPEQMKQAMDYSASIANATINEEIKQKLQHKETVVLAVGNLFNHGIRSFVYPSSSERTLTKEQLLQAVQQKAGMTDAQLSSDSFAEVVISNPLLVLGFMEALSIDKLTIVDVNNADGALTYPAYWK